MHVAVIGAGLAGLTAAQALARSGARVSALEAASAAGGQVRTERADGFIVELGAEGFVADSSAVLALCGRLGLGDHLVPQTERRTFILRDSALHELGPGQAAAILGLEAAAATPGRGLLTLRDGMGQLVRALTSALAGMADVRYGDSVRALAARGGAWALTLASGVTLMADAVVLAAPGHATARLISPFAPDTAAALERVSHASSVTVSLAYRRDAVTHPLNGSGFVVGNGSGTDLIACSFSSSKFPARAPAGWALLRAFFRPAPDAVAAVPNEGWAQRAHAFLADVLGIAGAARRAWVSRWPHALPQYAPGHEANLAAVVQQMRASAGAIELAGSYCSGRGIEGAVRSGDEAARRLLGGDVLRELGPGIV